MEERIARKIIEATLQLYEALGPLDMAISELKSEVERQPLSEAVGVILKISRNDVLLPVFREFPNLVPSSLTGKTSP